MSDRAFEWGLLRMSDLMIAHQAIRSLLVHVTVIVGVSLVHCRDVCFTARRTPGKFSASTRLGHLLATAGARLAVLLTLNLRHLLLLELSERVLTFARKTFRRSLTVASWLLAG